MSGINVEISDKGKRFKNGVDGEVDKKEEKVTCNYSELFLIKFKFKSNFNFNNN
jgi:hypothetical protein